MVRVEIIDGAHVHAAQSSSDRVWGIFSSPEFIHFFLPRHAESRAPLPGVTFATGLDDPQNRKNPQWPQTQEHTCLVCAGNNFGVCHFRHTLTHTMQAYGLCRWVSSMLSLLHV